MLRNMFYARWMMVVFAGCALAIAGCDLFGDRGGPTPQPTPECTTAAQCDDGNVCTDDACDDGECVYTNNTAECDDDDLCTKDDVCTNGVCTGTPIVCGAGEVCVDGACVPEVTPGPDGAALYADNCEFCHGENGTGGPVNVPVAGFSADELAAGLESDTHATISMTEEEIVAIAVFLGLGG